MQLTVVTRPVTGSNKLTYFKISANRLQLASGNIEVETGLIVSTGIIDTCGGVGRTLEQLVERLEWELNTPWK
jgi:hypothetical protein